MKISMFVLLFIALNGIAYSQVTFSKEELVEMVIETLEEELCAGPPIECVGISESECADKIKEFMMPESDEDSCDRHIPDEDIDASSIADIITPAAKCVIDKFIEKHEEAIMKNNDTKACKKWLEE